MRHPTPASAALAATLCICLAAWPGWSADAPAGEDPARQPGASSREFFTKMLPSDNVRAALEDEFRPAADRARDASEKIEEVLRASGIAREMRVADLRAADGYLAQILGPAVKWFGKVWANNDPASLDAATAEAWKKRLDDPSAADIARLDNPVTAPFPSYADHLDIVFSRGAYSDAVARGVDRGAMNAAIFAALAPGGKYVLVDARAAEGSAADQAATLCRVPEALVRKEIEAAGFRLAASSTALDESADAGQESACRGAAGRMPDRFLLVYEKPR